MEFKEELILIPDNLYKKKPKRKSKSKIKTLYYYKYNDELNKSEKVKAKIKATSKYFYKADFMYKDTALSEQNKVFDYYKVLKPHIPDKVAIKNLRVRNKKNTPEYTFKKEHSNNEPIIVKFD